MAHITLTGNITRDPELKYAQNGKAYAFFTIAWNERTKDKTGEWVDTPPMWVNVTCFGRVAENVAASLNKGNRVTVQGRAEPEEFHPTNGTPPTMQIRIVADSVAADLRFQTVQITKSGNRGEGQPPQQSQQQSGDYAQWQDTKPQQQDAWNTQPQQQAFPANNNDQPPF